MFNVFIFLIFSGYVSVSNLLMYVTIGAVFFLLGVLPLTALYLLLVNITNFHYIANTIILSFSSILWIGRLVHNYGILYAKALDITNANSL